MRWIICGIILLASTACAQTTRPDESPAPPSAPAQPPSADQLLNQMLRPVGGDRSAVLQPQPSQSTTAPAAPNSETSGILQEGTDVVDRVGRLQQTPDGQQQFVYESDGRTLADPPMVVLPNLKLMLMEGAVATASHDLRFRITGTVTEYHGHNYILLEKVVVMQDKNQEF